MKDPLDKYQPEFKEIHVLTDDSSECGAQSAGETFWEMARSFLAYYDPKTGELKNGEGRIVWYLTEKERRAKKEERFQAGCIYRLKVRELIDKTVPKNMLESYFNCFLFVEILEENIKNSELDAILKEYRRPVILTDEHVGELRLDKNLGLFEGRTTWLGKEIEVTLDVDSKNEKSWTGAMNLLHTLLEKQEKNDSEYRKFAAKKLTKLANEWNSDEETKISKEEFSQRMKVLSLSVSFEGDFSIYYEDDDMFFGHDIEISGSVKKGAKSADIVG